MTFEYDGSRFRVRWEHPRQRGKQTTRAVVQMQVRKMSGMHWEMVAEGDSHCHPKDRYDKELGQRKALADAFKNVGPLELGGFSREFRQAAFEAYQRERDAADRQALRDIGGNCMAALYEAEQREASLPRSTETNCYGHPIDTLYILPPHTSDATYDDDIPF